MSWFVGKIFIEESTGKVREFVAELKNGRPYPDGYNRQWNEVQVFDVGPIRDETSIRLRVAEESQRINNLNVSILWLEIFKLKQDLQQLSSEFESLSNAVWEGKSL